MVKRPGFKGAFGTGGIHGRKRAATKNTAPATHMYAWSGTYPLA